MFAQTFDGLWQINANFNEIEKKDQSEVLIEEASLQVENHKLILDTVELDASEVIKLKREMN